MNSTTEKRCAVSGTGGYLGGRVKAVLLEHGWKVVELTRRPKPDNTAIAFQLGESVSPGALAGVRALVHCAYDFKPLSWQAIHATNVAGSEKLFRSAQQAGVERLIYISSISAFDGCRSLYGKAKLESEAFAHSLGATVIRPGLIWGEPPTGMFGRLVYQVEKARILPLFGGGAQIQYLIHDEDLARFVCRCAEGPVEPSAGARPITVAHEQPWPFRQILEAIARAKGKRISFLPVPWRLLWAFVKGLETCHVPLNFKSDSLVSLMFQNPTPSFAAQRKLAVATRPFRLGKD